MPVAFPPQSFLDEVERRLDWQALGPWVSAVEARVRTPLSIAIFKMLLLRRWFGLTDDELDDACHAYEAFRRFLGAPLHGPVAEVWMFRQFAATLACAEEQIARFLTAVDLLLGDRGLAVGSTRQRGSTWLPGLRTTVFDRDSLAALARHAAEPSEPAPAPERVDPALAALYADDARITDRFRSPPTQAVPRLEWPWGLVSPVTDTLRIGRDPGFSPFARQLWADPRISRRHAAVYPERDGIGIHDLGASNGTYIDGELVPYGTTVNLTRDAELRFGPNLVVHLRMGRHD